MPSLKMTPCSGICETSTRGVSSVTLPKVMSAAEVRLGHGSPDGKEKVVGIPLDGALVTNPEIAPGEGRGDAHGAGKDAAKPSRVDPSPVETMMPLEECCSNRPPTLMV